MGIYSICSLNVEADDLPHSYQPFKIQNFKSIDTIDLSIKRTDKPHSSTNMSKITDVSYITIWKEMTNSSSFHWMYEAQNGMGSLLVDSDYTNVEYYCNSIIEPFIKDGIGEIFKSFFQIVLECKLAQKGFSVLHSACIELNGEAYAFTGPSGVGKSTRAAKWCELFGASWVSGDRPAVNTYDGYVYGVPWDGKEAVFRNVCFPLSGIYKVVRSETTEMKEMMEREKLELLCEQTFFPMWDRDLAAASMCSLKRIVTKFPIHELYCGISDDSIKKAYDILICNTIGV